MNINITNTNKTNVLKTVGKNTFRFIRETAGIDFEKPVIIRQGRGPFTLRKVCETIPGFNCNYTIMVIIDHYIRGWHVVKLTKSGLDFVTELKSATYFDFHTIPDTFYRKSDFEKLRKDDREFFVIAQLADYNLPLKQRKPYSYGRKPIDENKRYIIESKSYSLIVTGGEKYLHRLSLIEEGGTGKKFDWNIYENVPYRYGQKFELSELFDKSGYCVYKRRAELKAKAAKIRAERAKKEYMQTDTARYIPELKAALEEAKAFVSKEVLEISNYDAARDMQEKMRSIAFVYHDITHFEVNEREKNYPSVNAVKAEFEKIMGKIKELKAEKTPA